jgi:hypothetical protein
VLLQECMAVQIQSPEIFTAWFELRRTLCSWVSTNGHAWQQQQQQLIHKQQQQ